MFKKMAVLAVLALGVANAATYRITLLQPATVKGTQLKPGDYKLELENNTIRIVSGKVSAEAPVRVETVDTKYRSTSILYKDGAVSEIRIGGTATKLTLQ